MKSMKISAVVLGLAVAGVFAQEAAVPAANAAPAAATAEAQPAAEQPAAPAAAEAAPAQEAAAPAAPADSAAAQPAAAEAQPAAAPAAEAAPAQEAAAPAAATADTTAAAAVDSAAAQSAEAQPVVAPVAEPQTVAAAVPALAAEEESPTFKVSGSADIEADVLTYTEDKRFAHTFSSTFDLNFDVKFNDNWSAFVGIEADGLEAYPDFYLNGAYVQYKNSLLAVKLGDMTYAEGAFHYYRYDDATYYAAGMKEQSMRGVELSMFGIQAAVGFSANENTLSFANYTGDQDVYAFFAHLAYDLEFAGQKMRPYVNYKGYDLDTRDGKTINKFRAGMFMDLSFLNLLDIHAGYGFFDDVVTKSEPVVSHTFLIEPTISKGIFSLTGSVFYALLAENVDRATGIDLPERFYIYAEPAIQFLNELKVGVMGEYHTNSLDDDRTENEFAYLGPKIYFTPSKFITMQFFGAVILPLGDGDGNGTIINFTQDDDFLFDMGAELIFNF